MKALLLAAGLGTRLQPYTNEHPKPCIPFLGIPLAYYSLYLLHQAGCHSIVANLHHLPQEVKNIFSSCPNQLFAFNYSLEDEKPMGSGGALYYAKQLLSDAESFFAINSDEVFIPSRPDILLELKNHHHKTQSLLTLLVTDHPELGRSLKPIWVDAEGTVIAFGEKPKVDGVRAVHYTGCKIFSQSILPLLPSGESHIFHDTIVPAIARGAKVNTLFDDCQWWETGNFNSFLSATGDVIDLIAGNADAEHFKNVYTFLGKNFDIQVDNTSLKSAIHKSVKLQNVKMSGTVFIDEGCTISPNLSLHNCIINKNSRVTTSITDKMVFS